MIGGFRAAKNCCSKMCRQTLVCSLDTKLDALANYAENCLKISKDSGRLIKPSGF